MIILVIRTDKPKAELGLFDNNVQLAYEVWTAHRQLAETIHNKLREILNRLNKDLRDIEGIVCFGGPGSFTGLRIGLTVANSLAFAQQIPIIAHKNPRWIQNGINDLLAGKNHKIAVPEYGSPVNTTTPRK